VGSSEELTEILVASCPLSLVSLRSLDLAFQIESERKEALTRKSKEKEKVVKRSHEMPEDRLDEGFSLSASERGGRMRLRMRDLIAVRRTPSFH